MVLSFFLVSYGLRFIFDEFYEPAAVEDPDYSLFTFLMVTDFVYLADALSFFVLMLCHYINFRAQDDFVNDLRSSTWQSSTV